MSESIVFSSPCSVDVTDFLFDIKLQAPQGRPLGFFCPGGGNGVHLVVPESVSWIFRANCLRLRIMSPRFLPLLFTTPMALSSSFQCSDSYAALLASATIFLMAGVAGPKVWTQTTGKGGSSDGFSLYSLGFVAV